MKRLFDIVLSLMALLLLLPIMLLLALLVKMDSEGPVLFKQKRVGRNGHLFSMLKYRSMVVNAAQVGPHFTSSCDPRVTRIGRFLRKSSLDELPQLINVVLGDMSLVGPRPNVLIQRDEYTVEDWAKRNSVRPGITGLAQALMRSEATAEERTRLDLEYVDNSSLKFDLHVMLLTIKQVLRKGGH